MSPGHYILALPLSDPTLECKLFSCLFHGGLTSAGAQKEEQIHLVSAQAGLHSGLIVLIKAASGLCRDLYRASPCLCVDFYPSSPCLCRDLYSIIPMSVQGFLLKHLQENHHRDASGSFLSLEQEMQRQAVVYPGE